VFFLGISAAAFASHIAFRLLFLLTLLTLLLLLALHFSWPALHI